MHTKAPWGSVEEIGGGKGLLAATVRWQISGDEMGAKLLWERYRTFDAVSSSLVERTARDAVINVSTSYPASTAIISQGRSQRRSKPRWRPLWILTA